MINSVNYYEIFPNYSVVELVERYEQYPFHIATGLNLNNIRNLINCNAKAIEAFVAYLRSDATLKRRYLKEFLETLPLKNKILPQSIAKVPREFFVKEEFRMFSYLDWYIPFNYASCLTSPGLIAYMIDRLQVNPEHKILEIGIGSGYHASCIAEHVGADICGVDIDIEFLKFGKNCVEETGYSKYIKMEIAQEGIIGWPYDSPIFDRIYCPVAMKSLPTRLFNQLAEDGMLQYIRSVNEEEFYTYNEESWLRQKFKDYEEYLNSEDWRSWCLLVTAKNIKGILEEIETLEGVGFVPLRKSNSEYLEYPIPNPFSDLEIYF